MWSWLLSKRGLLSNFLRKNSFTQNMERAMHRTFRKKNKILKLLTQKILNQGILISINYYRLINGYEKISPKNYSVICTEGSFSLSLSFFLLYKYCKKLSNHILSIPARKGYFAKTTNGHSPEMRASFTLYPNMRRSISASKKEMASIPYFSMPLE